MCALYLHATCEPWILRRIYPAAIIIVCEMLHDTSDVELRGVIHYHYLRGSSASTCHTEMQRAYSSRTPVLRTIQKWYRAFAAGKSDLEDKPRSGRPKHLFLSEPIRSLLQDQPALSTRALASALSSTPQTVKSILVETLGYRKLSTHWIPHVPTPEILRQRCQIAETMLTILLQAESTGFRYVYTGDESWFYLSTASDSMWVPPESAAPSAATPTIKSEKIMVTIFWSTAGFSVVEALPKDDHLTAQYLIDKIFRPLEHNIAEGCKCVHRHRIYIHMDNARVHTAKIVKDFLSSSFFRGLPQPPYSPDIAPSDFYLFGMLKTKLQGRTFRTSGELMSAIRHQLSQISHDELCSVYQNWIVRLRQVIDSGGQYL